MDSITLVETLVSSAYKESPGEIYMSTRQLMHFETLLHMQRRALLKRIDKTSLRIQDESSRGADETDRAGKEEKLEMDFNERRFLKEIEDALARLKLRDFGYCEDCGLKIGLRRLEVSLTTKQCIDCKTFEENKRELHRS